MWRRGVGEEWAKIPGMRKTTKPAVPGAHQELHDFDEAAKIAGTSVTRSMVRLVVGGGLGLALTYGAGALFGGVASMS